MEKLHKAIDETKGLDVVKAGQYTLSQWMRVWYENYATVKVCPSSHATYMGIIKNHIDPAVGQIPLTKLTTLDLQKFYRDQLTAFLREAKNTGVFEMYYLEWATGLRRGELLGLKWQDVNFNQGTITVRRQIGRINGVVTEGPLKTKNAYRVIPVGGAGLGCAAQSKRENCQRICVPLPKRWAYLAGQRALRRVLKRAGLPYVRFYDLRHTSATLALQHGVDVKMVSGMLGHFSVEKKMEIRGP